MAKERPRKRRSGRKAAALQKLALAYEIEEMLADWQKISTGLWDSFSTGMANADLRR